MKQFLDWKKYEYVARQAIAEGCVLLENKNSILPLKNNSKVAVFGRIQNDYYKSGTGSGGMVNVSKVYNIVEGLEECGKVIVNQYLKKIYIEYCKEHPYDAGLGWGKERWSQDEMPLTDDIVIESKKESDIAIIIIGRTAGEDKDASDTKGSYKLTDEELDMMKLVRKYYDKIVVLLNTGSIIDMTFIDIINPEAVMYVWQGGMLGGLGTADALTGEIPPSGKLTDTIAYSIEDYPSTPYFGVKEKNYYKEDIFVGYRYFETFAKDKVRYPFGFGLSYSSFAIDNVIVNNSIENKKVSVWADVTNIGNASAKEVVQVYVKAPAGKLGKASRVLVGFEKTRLLSASEKQTLCFDIPYVAFCSYDDSGITENKSCYLLEEGAYEIYVGNDVRNASLAGGFVFDHNLILRQCEEALAPIELFERMHANSDNSYDFESVPMSTVSMADRRKSRIPNEIKQSNDIKYKLSDVYNKNVSMDEFIAQLSDEDLSCIIRGEGMGSSLVTAGTASAFGGVSPRLRNDFGIPAVCCDDGPSGMRLDCGIKAFSLPNGVMLASSFNKELVEELYSYTSLEMISNHVECLLGPGMNIHRHPLNGRNFEYFSEDPYVTGMIGLAMIKGLKTYGVTGTAKHFCGNNQEFNRRDHNSVISERALREIYLKGFEIIVRSGYADSIMTTYGAVNGLFTAGSYDLNTTILRDEWGFDGIVMTDWWADINEIGVPKSTNNFAAMVMAQNDLYMVCPDGSTNATGDNTLEKLNSGELSRAELQRCAKNICNFVMKSQAMKRCMDIQDEIEIINRAADDTDIAPDDVEYITMDGDMTIDLTYQECKANVNYVLALDVKKTGTYEVTVTGSSELNELAQLPCTLFYSNIPTSSFTFHGTNGETMSVTRENKIRQRFCVARLFVARNGLKLEKIEFKYLNDNVDYN